MVFAILTSANAASVIFWALTEVSKWTILIMRPAAVRLTWGVVKQIGQNLRLIGTITQFQRLSL